MLALGPQRFHRSARLREYHLFRRQISLVGKIIIVQCLFYLGVLENSRTTGAEAADFIC